MYKTKGIILKKYDAGEADRVYIVYTQNYGKKQLFAKGARKIKSKLAGHLTHFAEIEFDFIKGRSREQITGAQICKNFEEIKNELRKIAVGSYILNVVDNMVKWDYPDSGVYDLIREALKSINKQNDVKKAYFTANIFVWKFLVLQGYGPILNKCADCGSLMRDRIYLSRQKGGLICENCGVVGEKRIEVHRNSIDYLKGICKNSARCDEIIKIIKNFLYLNLDTELKSEVWLGKLF